MASILCHPVKWRGVVWYECNAVKLLVAHHDNRNIAVRNVDDDRMNDD